MREITMHCGVGVGDLQPLLSAFMKQARGDRNRAVKLALAKLVDMEIISAEELQDLTKLSEKGFRAGKAGSSVDSGYLEARRT